MRLDELEVYQLARDLGRKAWNVYSQLHWRDRGTMGDQFITATDSIAANIAEAFGRFHYLDKNRFHYTARGSLVESKHWLDVLKERSKIDEENYAVFSGSIDTLHIKLNNYINSTKERKLASRS